MISSIFHNILSYSEMILPLNVEDKNLDKKKRVQNYEPFISIDFPTFRSPNMLPEPYPSLLD